MTVVLPQILFERDSFGGSGNTKIDNDYVAKRLSQPGSRLCFLIYGDTKTSDNIALVNNSTLPSVSFNYAACIQWCYEQGAVVNSSGVNDKTIWVIIDVEEWLDYYLGYLYSSYQAQAIAIYRGLYDAIKNEFGYGVMLSVWGNPIVRNYNDSVDGVDWVHADADGHNGRVLDAATRFAPLMHFMDFIVPNCYELCPNADTMNPSKRPWLVTTGGTSIPVPDTIDYNEFHEQWFSLQMAQIDAAKLCNTINAQSKLIFPSFSSFFFPNTPVFNTGTVVGPFQTIPQAQFNSSLARLIEQTDKRWHYWAANKWRFNLAFREDLPDVPVQSQFRNWISRTFMRGVDPGNVAWVNGSVRESTSEVENTAVSAVMSSSQGSTVMSKKAVAAEIRTRFQNLVAIPENLTVIYENENKDTPNGLHVALEINWGDAMQVSSGVTARHRTVGTMVASIRHPVGNGDKAALELVDVIEGVFTAKTLSNLTFRTPVVNTVGQTNKFWQIDVICPFYTDAIK